MPVLVDSPCCSTSHFVTQNRRSYTTPTFSAGERRPPCSPVAVSEITLPPPCQLAQTRHGPMLVNPNDLFMGQSFLRYGECCEREIQTLLQLLSHPQSLPGIVVEVGSNMGVHTIPLARELARQGRQMLAIEPQPVIFQQLCANLALNGLFNVTALPFACAAEPGALHFAPPDYRNPGNFGGTTMSANAETPETQTVSCHTLDSLVSSYFPAQPVALIKIDAEGYELRVLQGAGSLISEFHPILYVENDRLESSGTPGQSARLIQHILDLGYRLWWHITQAYQPNNFRNQSHNIYGEVSLINMLCLHPSHNSTIQGLPEITDPNDHPLTRVESFG
jgi:FkbM family methyltransferase